MMAAFSEVKCDIINERTGLAASISGRHPAYIGAPPDLSHAPAGGLNMPGERVSYIHSKVLSSLLPVSSASYSNIAATPFSRVSRWDVVVK